MAWIEAHQNLSKHRKLIKTAGRLSVDRHKLIGHLLEFWWWALDNVPSNGFMENITDDEISIAAEWNEDHKIFVQALIEGGFIEEKPDGRWLHDWYDYAGKLLDKREKEKKRSKIRRSTSGRNDGRLTDSHSDTRGLTDERPPKVARHRTLTVPKEKELSTVARDAQPDKNPESGSSDEVKPRSRRGYTEDEKKPVVFLKSLLEERGVRDFAKDWHLKGYAVSRAMLTHRTSEELTALVGESLSDPYWAHRVTDMYRVQDYAKERALRESVLPPKSQESMRRPEPYQHEAPVTAEEDMARQRALDEALGYVQKGG